jgi:hypothetical protein
VKNRHLAIFAGWQLAGFLAGMGAHHLDMISWWVADLMLLPGTLTSFYFFRPGGPGNNWSKWTLFAIPVAVNTALFLALFFLRRKKTTSSS